MMPGCMAQTQTALAVTDFWPLAATERLAGDDQNRHEP
jgi:hypothetical protein